MNSIQLKPTFFHILPFPLQLNQRPCVPFNVGKCRVSARAEARDTLHQDQTSQKKLRLFIDSANVEDWKKWLPTGVFHGVTTSPVQLEKANIACHPKRLASLAAEAVKLATIKSLGGTLRLLVEDLNNLDQIEDLTSCGIGSLALPIPFVEQLFGDTNTQRDATEQETAALKNPYRLFF